jgi:hypothetical protein
MLPDPVADVYHIMDETAIVDHCIAITCDCYDIKADLVG